MALPTGRVIKRAVLRPQCNEDYLFRLREIAENAEWSRLAQSYLPGQACLSADGR
jgi:hypothetical protein